VELGALLYAERKEPEHIPKEIMVFTPRGTRPIGGLKLRWKDKPILYGSKRPNIYVGCATPYIHDTDVMTKLWKQA
jgi:hypothetical protein